MTSAAWNYMIATMLSMTRTAHSKPVARRVAPPRATKGRTAPLHLKMSHDVIRSVVKMHQDGKNMKEISDLCDMSYHQVTKVVYNYRKGKFDGKVKFD